MNKELIAKVAKHILSQCDNSPSYIAAMCCNYLLKHEEVYFLLDCIYDKSCGNYNRFEANVMLCYNYGLFIARKEPGQKRYL